MKTSNAIISQGYMFQHGLILVRPEVQQNEGAGQKFVNFGHLLQEAAMRPNRKGPESTPFWFQNLIFYCRPHGGLLHDRADALE